MSDWTIGHVRCTNNNAGKYSNRWRDIHKTHPIAPFDIVYLSTTSSDWQSFRPSVCSVDPHASHRHHTNLILYKFSSSNIFSSQWLKLSSEIGLSRKQPVPLARHIHMEWLSLRIWLTPGHGRHFSGTLNKDSVLPFSIVMSRTFTRKLHLLHWSSTLAD